MDMVNVVGQMGTIMRVCINITFIFIHIISYNYFTGEFKNGLQHGKGH
jgi:hypothetical protein